MAPDDRELSEPPSAADSLEQLLAGAVAAPASFPVLVRDTVVADRYVVERLLGAGGMGAVYLARDRVLDRPVALKMHRTASLAERLRREAVAMARLAHPNVVTVFEVGTFDQRAFVAMEYVEGETLRAWLDARSRSHREIVDVLLAAGEGLAAAHAAGLVHRDVKPENILLGRDGRVRIGDFGLAQLAATSDGPVDALIGGDTATGAVVGTPAYMAPEQIEGRLVDARTDQFAFCVAAWEALAGARPFPASSTDELRDVIARGVPRAPRSALPPRFRRVLARGLAARPEARWPSMRALLQALRAARRQPRVLTAWAIAALCAGAATAVSVWPGHDAVAACDAMSSAFDRELPTDSTDALVARVAAEGSEPARLRADLLARAIDEQRTSARAVTRSACRARATRTWSGELATASAQCLTDHARTVREILLGLPWPADGLDLLTATSDLPDVQSCGDARLLAGWRSLGGDASTLDAVTTARARIEAARARLALGRIAGAAELHVEVARSPVADGPGVRGRLELLRGMLLIASGEYAAGEHVLSDAYFAARGSDDGELALRLVGALIELASITRRDAEAAQRWTQNGIADAQRDRGRHPRAAADVVLRASRAAASAADGELALERLALAEEMHDAHPQSTFGLGLLDARVDALASLGRTDEAIAASVRHVESLRTALGEHHPALASALSGRTAVLLEASRYEEAAEVMRELQQVLEQGATADSAQLAVAELNFGAILLSLEDPRARTYLTLARARWVALHGEDHPDVALADMNLALSHLDEGDAETALVLLRRAISVQERVLGPEHTELASGLYNLAVAERQAGLYEAALATARRTAAIYAARQPGSPRHIYALGHIAMIANLAGRATEALAAAEAAMALPASDGAQAHAWARLEAARAWITLGRPPARARKLLDEARSGYGEAKLSARVAEIDALRATLR